MAFAPTTHTHTLERLLEPLRDTTAAVLFLCDERRDRPASDRRRRRARRRRYVVTTPTKLLSGYLSGRAYALTPRRSMRVGLGMVTRGEFSLIIAAVALTGAGA